MDFTCYKCKVRNTVLYRKDKVLYCKDCYDGIKRKEGQEKEDNEDRSVSRVETRDS